MQLENTVILLIQERLAQWFRENKRDLPWRGASPYAVWVSEIMLQQTQVATAIPYFNRFLERFPTIETLASAPIDEVLKYWAGLGYYARARNLHKASQIVVENFGGAVPNDPKTLRSLPGVGRYTSGAILSIAYNLPEPIVDGNVIRVISRLFGIKGDPKSSTNQGTLWEIAESLVPREAPGDFNQGLMELGALVCEPAEPKCETCPLLQFCFAGNSPEPNAYPEIPAGKATVRAVHVSAALLNEKDEVLIVQRPLHGLWGGLWEFPRVKALPGEKPSEAAVRAMQEAMGMKVEAIQSFGDVVHSVTHFRIKLHGVLTKSALFSGEPILQNYVGMQWVGLYSLSNFALSAPQVLLKNQLIDLISKKKRGGQASLTLEM